jgi:hypothetical protein
MKRLFWALFAGLVFLYPIGLFAQPEADIVIEMQGMPDNPPDGIPVWKKNSRQLNRLLRGKTREKALYLITSVSSYDDILQAQDGKRYALVRYGSENGDFRKLLFQAQDPQTFITSATNAAEVLDIQKKYGLNIGLHQTSFLNTYEQKATLSNLLDEKKGKTYSIYRVDFSTSNNPKPDVRYFLFEDEMLSRTFMSEEDFFEFMNILSNQNKEIRQARERQQKEKITQEEKKREEIIQKKNRPVRKALVSGGTVEDRMYMPRAVNATPLPPLTPSKTPAGTPIIHTQL